MTIRGFAYLTNSSSSSKLFRTRCAFCSPDRREESANLCYRDISTVDYARDPLFFRRRLNLNQSHRARLLVQSYAIAPRPRIQLFKVYALADHAHTNVEVLRVLDSRLNGRLSLRPTVH